MSLNNAVLKQNATSIDVTGGTDLTFASLGSPGDKNTIYAVDDPDVRTRRDVICSSNIARVKADAPNGYTQSRRSVFIKVPLTLDNGKVTVNTFKGELSTDVETTDAEKLEIRQLAAQVMIDSDFIEFWDNGALV